MPISQARTIAFGVLLRVAKQDAYANDVLCAEMDKMVKTEDAGLATELALGVLRWQRLLDPLIAGGKAFGGKNFGMAHPFSTKGWARPEAGCESTNLGRGDGNRTHF